MSKRTLFVLLPFLLIFAACTNNDEPAAETPSTDTTAEAPAEPSMPATPAAKLNLNTATGDEFRTIPDVGDRMVHEFEEYRPYVSIQQFRREMGKYVDEAQVTAYEQYVFVPIDYNGSDAPTLMQIPGLNQAAAEALIAARPFDSMDLFLEQLREYVTDAQASTGKMYLATQ